MGEPKALNKKQVEEWESTLDKFDLSHMSSTLVSHKRSAATIRMLAMGMGREDWVAYAKVELSMDTPDGMILAVAIMEGRMGSQESGSSV